jgi:hypothetical protein
MRLKKNGFRGLATLGRILVFAGVPKTRAKTYLEQLAGDATWFDAERFILRMRQKGCSFRGIEDLLYVLTHDGRDGEVKMILKGVRERIRADAKKA